MTAGTLLSRLDKVRATGRGRWTARCPAHDDRGPSLAIRELDDGRVLVHCFAGCGMPEIVSAVGLSPGDLFPERSPESHATKGERRPFSALDVLRCIAHEALIVAITAMRLGAGHAVQESERTRMTLAASRLGAAVDLAEGA